MTGSTGCSIVNNAYKTVSRSDCLDEFMLSHRNRVFAAKAWYREQHCFKNRANLNEFKAGFLQGYMDIATGADGCSPCVAPSQYWGWKYQSPGGQCAIDAWFAGYPLGVKAAEQDGVGNWGRVHVQPPHTPTAQQTAAKPADEAVKPQPVLGPDGQPLTAPDEIIVPGTTKIIERPATDSLAPEVINPPTPAENELLELPETPGAETSTPDASDEVLLQLKSSQSLSLTDRVNPVDEDQDQLQVQPTENDADVSLVPSQSNAVYSLGDMDDSTIEDLFGSIEMPKALVLPASSSSESSEVQLGDQKSAAETARAEDTSIPFKFE